MTEAISTLIQRWKDDPHSTYTSWFLWSERLKNFRSIRRGIAQVVQDIAVQARHRLGNRANDPETA